MTGKRAENSMEIRAYIKARSLLGLMPIDIHREVTFMERHKCPIGSVCRWVAKFKASHQDAASSGHSPTVTAKSNTKKITNFLNQDA